MEVYKYEEEFICNSRGVQLFTCRWLPLLTAPKGLVFLCHGYGVECSVFMRDCGIRLARAGYGVFGIDYEGHGKSKGPRCYIKRFSNIVKDCNDFFRSICLSKEYEEMPRFLYGESMGGAVALLLHRKELAFWNGAVLVAPMCKISEKIKPHPVVVKFLTKVAVFAPMWKIVPTKDVIDTGFQDPIKREQIRSNGLIYQDKPRLKTALEMLMTSMDLEDRLQEVTVPFLLLHGEEDSVTDPSVSEALYNSAGSSDKTIKLYPGMWHALTTGEPDHNVDLVFADIISWLDRRLKSTPLLARNDQEDETLTTIQSQAAHGICGGIQGTAWQHETGRDKESNPNTNLLYSSL